MAFKKVYKSGERCFCYSSDTILTTGFHDSDTLTVIDTGEKFVWFDGGWEEDLTIVYAMKKALEEQS